MIAKLKELRKNEDGFTLIELMVVVLIIGILAAIAIPVFLNLQKEGYKASIKSDVKNTVTAVATALASDSDANVATARHEAPTAIGGTTSNSVVTEGNAITITVPSAGNYVVTGERATTAAQADGFTYTFTSSTGAYTP